MKDYLFAEYIKGKRTFSHFFFMWFPLIIVLMCIPFSRFMFFDINYFVPLVYNWWSILFLPMGLATLSYQSIQREKEAHMQNYYHLFNQSLFWKTKLITILLYSLLANIALAILTIFTQCIIYDSSNIIVLDVLLSSIILWISTLFIIPISILLAQLTTPILCIVINILGLIVSTFIEMKSYWYICPYGWSLRAIIPIIKTRPNGTQIDASDPLNSTLIVYPPLGLAFLLFIILYISVPLILSRNKEDQQ